MAGTRIIRTLGLLVLSVLVLHIETIGNLQAQAPGTTGHEHLTEVACVDVPAGEKRPEYGCFNVGAVTGLQFSRPTVYWYLRMFGNREAAEAANGGVYPLTGNQPGSVIGNDGKGSGRLCRFGSVPRRS